MTSVLIKRENQDTERYTWEKDDEKTQGKEGHLEAKERCLEQTFTHNPQNKPIFPTS